MHLLPNLGQDIPIEHVFGLAMYLTLAVNNTYITGARITLEDETLNKVATALSSII